MIYLQPHSGLANRIRVIVSGLNFSDKVKQPVILIWRKDDSLFSEFTDLFEPIDKMILKKYNRWAGILNGFQNRGLLNRIFCRIFSIDFCLFDRDLKEFVWSTGSNNINLSKIPKKVTHFYFHTCHEFYFDSAYLKFLQPTKTIRDNIESNIVRFNKKTIGVHIRRTDHFGSILESPLESFIEVMRKDIAEDKDINYFLATDDKEVEIILKELFKDKIIIYEKEYSRTSVKGIQDAVVDLYSLSATSKIYGSFFSSFSDVASRIGNIPLQIIKR